MPDGLTEEDRRAALILRDMQEIERLRAEAAEAKRIAEEEARKEREREEAEKKARRRPVNRLPAGKLKGKNSGAVDGIKGYRW